MPLAQSNTTCHSVWSSPETPKASATFIPSGKAAKKETGAPRISKPRCRAAIVLSGSWARRPLVLAA
jgi:hypothetical protein